MEIDFSAEDGEPRYSFESCGADTDADGVVTFEVCGAPMIVRQGGELGERLWASGMDLAREIERGVALRHVPEHLIASRPFGSPVRRANDDGGDPPADDSSGLKLDAEDAGEDPLRHARVLELGAGCAGLPGLAMALRHGCTVTLTEHPDVVPLLRANVAQFQARISAMAGVNEISETVADAAARASFAGTASVPAAYVTTDGDDVRRVVTRRSASPALGASDGVVWADAGYLGDDNDALLTAAVACVAPGGKILACESLRSQAKTTTFRRIFGALGFFCVKVLGDGVKGNVDAWVYAMTWQCEAEACLARKRIAEGSFTLNCEREVQPAVTWKPRTTMTRSASDSSPRKWQSSKLRA